MPIKGRSRKARPLNVYSAIKDVVPHPKPRKDETFAQFLVRLEGTADDTLLLLIRIGYGEPSQREYLNRLQMIRDELHAVNFSLHQQWKDA